MKCDPTLYRATPPSLAVKPRLIRHLFLPPLVIALMIGLGYIGFWTSEHFGIRSLGENGQRQLELHARASKARSANTPTCPACWSSNRAFRSCWTTRPRNTGKRSTITLKA